MKKELEVEYFDVGDKPYGKTYGQWTVKWWQWALSIPKSINPLVDETGRNAHVNQPEKDVWFLAGTIATENSTKETYREVMVPPGRAILFPVINCEASPIEYPHLKTDEDLAAYVKEDENAIVRKEAFVNGNPIPPKRVASDPPVFPISVCGDNWIGVTGGITRASADGYYVFLKPLSDGEYNINFRGACEAGRLNSAAKYKLKVK